MPMASRQTKSAEYTGVRVNSFTKMPTENRPFYWRMTSALPEDRGHFSTEN